MTRLANGDQALVDLRKLEEYCLSPVHPRGRHKARVFRQALDIDLKDARWLRDQISEAARAGEAVELGSDAFGERWQIDFAVERHGKNGIIRTVWIMRNGEGIPRFITCWVL